MTNPTARPEISARLLAALLGQPMPTDQQAAVIEAPPGPLLIVAGAGAGKTATMASRVVWLVANGYCHPDEVLGLTFTRKAAQQLGKRIRDRLAQLAGSPKLAQVDPTGRLAEVLANAAPTTATYDSYAGSLVSEYGLLLPVEPGARIIGDSEQFVIASEVVENYTGALETTYKVDTVIDYLLRLEAELATQQADPQEVAAEAEAFVRLVQELPRGKRQKETINKKLVGWMDTQQLRAALLELVEQLHAEYDERQVSTFHAQMQQAARLASEHSAVGEAQRRKFRVVMLDEYQDTSHAQRVLLRSLFGQGVDPELTVNAVGDPMQAIYSWRGATSNNLSAFVQDFSVDGVEPAPKAELTTSFRNPKSVLAVANDVSAAVLGPAGSANRTVAALEPFGENAGEVEFSWFETAAEERAAIADHLAEAYRKDKEAGERFTAAVLVRANAAAVPIYAELAARGVPAEIVSSSGLIDIPEVADLIAVATMLARPADNAAALRVLTSPMVGLSLADVKALGARARTLAERAQPGAAPADENPAGSAEDDARARLLAEIAQATPVDTDQLTGLADAVADPGEGEGLSSEGLTRIRRLNATLRQLRTSSLHKALPELFADIELAMGLRTEVLAEADPNADGAPGVVHLDKFFDEVAAFGAVPGATLGQFLDFLQVARDRERGLAPGEVTVRADRVQILTVHKAKGLEWRHVAVAHVMARGWEGKAETFLTNVFKLPPGVGGDPDAAEDFTAGAAEDRREFEQLAGEYNEAEKAQQNEEAARLFYVAVTRAEAGLWVSGASFTDTAQSQGKPFEPFAQLKNRFPDAVGYWFVPEDKAADGATDIPDAAAGGDAEEPNDVLFPAVVPRPGARAAASEIGSLVAAGELPGLADDELSYQWEADVTALVEEQRALDAPVVEVVLGGRLTASDLVNLKRDPIAFARWLRRPVPFKPNSYAKRGTAFHAWLEDRFAGASLLDEDQLPGLGEEEVDPARLSELKEKFLESEWAERTPMFVELPFEVLIGGRVVGGRMDAVFFDEANDEWLIVDWKTGAPPKGAELRAAAIQLAVYRVAFLELLRVKGKEPKPVRAVFHYVGHNFTLEPKDLAGYAELSAILEF